MSVIHLKDFPEDLHRALKIRAAETGTSVKALMIRYCMAGLEEEWSRKREVFVAETLELPFGKKGSEEKKRTKSKGKGK